MSNPNTERDYKPIHTPVYTQVDLERAATRMRDRCVQKVRDAIHDLSRTAIAAEQNAKEIDLLIKLREEVKALTLEGEQEK